VLVGASVGVVVDSVIPSTGFSADLAASIVGKNFRCLLGGNWTSRFGWGNFTDFFHKNLTSAENFPKCYKSIILIEFV
jgi:hypothetical protein